MLKFRKALRGQMGSSIVELAGAIVVFPVVTIFSVSCAMGIFAAWVTDGACRDAARAAGQQPTQARAIQAAKLAMDTFKGGVLTPKLSDQPDEFRFETYPDANGRPQMDKGPFVHITTSAQVDLPLPIVPCEHGLTKSVTIKRSCIFPLIAPGSQLPPPPAEYDDDPSEGAGA